VHYMYTNKSTLCKVQFCDKDRRQTETNSGLWWREVEERVGREVGGGGGGRRRGSMNSGPT
jgi:hypothetical protein